MHPPLQAIEEGHPRPGLREIAQALNKVADIPVFMWRQGSFEGFFKGSGGYYGVRGLEASNPNLRLQGARTGLKPFMVPEVHSLWAFFARV